MNKEFWEKNAQSWTQAIQARLVESRKITNPAMIQQIMSRQPHSVLDLGCGEGWIASQLLAHGIKYFGLDFSRALIELAKSSHTAGKFEAVAYEEIENGKWAAQEKFDLIIFNFALFQENLVPLLSRCSAWLKDEGAILIQTLHPLYVLDPYQDGWRTEDFKTFPIPFDGTMKWYGRTLESWLKAFSESGLKVTATIEPLSLESGKPLSIIFALALK